VTRPASAFTYRTSCSAPVCAEAAVYKLAALWSDGTSRELKNYGLACEAHRGQLLAAARLRHEHLKLSEGETVGLVELYFLAPRMRDVELVKLNDTDR
jgi:hypothetical protein